MSINQDDGLLLVVASAAAAGLIWREVSWWLRVRRWRPAEGRVVEIVENGVQDGPGRPLVEYEREGAMVKFEATEFKEDPEIGEVIPVLFDPLSERAALYTFGRRWCLSAVLVLVAALALAAAFLTPLSFFAGKFS